MTPAGYFWLTYLTTLIIGGLSFLDITPRLLWNATASAPVGFYMLRPESSYIASDLVAVTPPEPLERFMVERGYIGADVPMLKRIAGLPGQQVCRSRSTITVDGVELGAALEHDRLGRELPNWQGCKTIAQGELFLMNWQVLDSLDGRYFGPLPASSVIGRALPLWTDEEGDGRFKWRAPTH